MKNIPPYHNREITVHAQLYRLKHDFPDSEGRILSKNTLVWSCKIQPQANSDFYNIEIRYNLRWQYPKVFVKNRLKLYPGSEKLPHVFDHEKQQICLNYNKEWNRTLPISTYYVPWASEWLFYYETWVITGEWLGKSIHDGKLYE